MREWRVVLRRGAARGRRLGDVNKLTWLGASYLALLLAIPAMEPVFAAPVAAPVPAASAASDVAAPGSSRRVKRPLTAQELRESATFPGDLRPEDMPPPQVNLPLGRKPPPPSASDAAAAAQDAAVPGKIDDRVARCKAQADPRQRAACTRALAASEPVRR